MSGAYFEEPAADDFFQPRKTDILRIPGWDSTYTQNSIHWSEDRKPHNANYVAVPGHIIAKVGNNTEERSITVFVDSMIYSPRYTYLETQPNLHKSAIVKVRSVTHNDVAIPNSGYLEFNGLKATEYDIQYAEIPLTTSGNKKTYFLVIHPKGRRMNSVSSEPTSS